ncbi:gamma-glutamyltransferase family protein [Cellulomonas shaoxiangyii]|uniref:Gamma-glutamyltransferase family protein n=1 Tax=Cellulomonas shaoxiangyii TaxID=2566013 RepID=A0A4P7SNK5_9CELL|nr:gamma-glutamyltransferase [Cellulomonas shaoxiangyii]QCB95127.1 gamma-glutamyltransferase family protein [Cellulomonas shaoxiangyii]TGY82826.1 gamma-glutamyltransferase family protein [Cellulomonas shaoxiangyii]
MVGSTHWLASAVGMRTLEAGGNAFDAAVAAGFTLSVVEPHLNGPGGDVPIIGHRAADGGTFVVVGQGTAPALATPLAFAALGVDVVPGTGHLAAVVPGAFGAWLDLLARYGTMTLAEVLAPAIGYARDGYPLVPAAARTVATVADMFAAHWPTSAEVYLAGGHAPAAGSRFANPALAATFERLVAEAESAGPDREAQVEAARRAFYEGFVAEAVDTFVAGTPVMDATGSSHTGLLRGDDLAAWRATEEPTVSVPFAGVEVHKTAAWGQGPVLLQQLRLLDALGVDGLVRDVVAAEARGEVAVEAATELVHLATEAAKLAFADRDAWYGDSADVPLDALLSAAYAAERARLVGADADGGYRPGSPDGREPVLPRALVEARAEVEAGRGAGGAAAGGLGEPTVSALGLSPGDTCHVDVVDRWGNRVSATPSGGWLQSSPVVPGLGFALPTRAQMFWLQQGLASSLVPGTRPRTTLSPALVLGGDGSGFAFGTPGGDQQDQWTVPFLLRHLVGGADLQAAIDGASWHSTHVHGSFHPRTHTPRGLSAESRLGAPVLAALAARGHALQDAGAWSLGRISAAGVRADGLLEAAANPRGMQGYAVGR